MPDATLPTTPETPAEKSGPSNLRLRVIWGLIGAALLLGSVWFSPWTFGLFFAFVQAVMLWEFYRMMRAGGYVPNSQLGIAAGSLIFIAAIVCFQLFHPILDIRVSALARPIEELRVIREQPEQIGLFAKAVAFILITVHFVALIRELVAWPRLAQPFINIGLTIGGLLYIGIPMALLVYIAYSGHGYEPFRVFALLFLIWASDIGAYAAGKTFGKHKMAPKISPGKTWEGWAGGFLLTLVVGWAVGFMLPDMPLTHRLVAAGVVAVFAPLGDLAESMLKRSVGVKDSGSIMPGHGGLLDRFDAFLLVLPVLALLQLLAG